MKTSERSLRLVERVTRGRQSEPLGTTAAAQDSAAAGSQGSRSSSPSGEADDERELVARARNDDTSAFELLMRRNNQRLYRVIRSLLKDPTEAEDVMQHAYLQAFVHLDQFDGTARWSTWVCRIAINAAMARLRHQGQFVPLDTMNDDMAVHDCKAPVQDPERTVASRELGQVVEQAIDNLPESYRTVLVMREIEGMSTAEAAQVLGVDPDVIRTRLHRARSTLRNSVEDRMGERMKTAYAFGNERCDRMVARVISRLRDKA